MLIKLDKNKFKLSDKWVKNSRLNNHFNVDFEVFYPTLDLSKKIHIHGFRAHLNDYENRHFKRIFIEQNFESYGNIIKRNAVEWEVKEYNSNTYTLNTIDAKILEDVYQELMKKENRSKKLKRILN